MDNHIIYASILILFFVMDAGRYFGLDGKIFKKTEK